jgi:hypothetical protein
VLATNQGRETRIMKNQSVPGCGLGRVRCRIDKQTNLQRAGWFVTVRFTPLYLV